MRTLVLLVFLVGCSPNPTSRIALGPEWLPLRWVVRDRTVGEDRVRTDRGNVYVRDPDRFMRSRALERDAVLAHERVHAQREDYFGWDNYQARLRDPGYRTLEEKLGWQAQIRWHGAAGEALDPYWVAWALTSYQPPLTLDYQTALIWAANEVTESLKPR